MMLAKQSPSSVVYPTLVDVNANEEKPPQELQHILNCLVMGISFSNSSHFCALLFYKFLLDP